MTRWKDWAQLVRVPNTLTACADTLAGFSIAAGAWNASHAIPLIIASCASICMYWAGMALNDVNDIEEDKQNRRKGPIVEGRIALQSAWLAGWGLLIAGVVLSVIAAGMLVDANRQTRLVWPCLTAILLAATIVLYDSPIKKSILGPWCMGACRSLNLLLGFTIGLAAIPDIAARIGDLKNTLVVLPIAHGLFVVGITLAARKESSWKQSSLWLASSWLVGFIAVVGLSISTLFASQDLKFRMDPQTGFPLLIALMASPWLIRAIRSIRDNTVSSLVPAIKQAILTILFFDAAVALQFAGNVAGLIVCSLAIPTFALGRWFRVT